jgi:ATP-dependent helicase/DNAse subunit B
MVKLSASKIKTLAHCSWIYYATYVLKIPRSTNDGARAGTVIHLLLECLLNKRHNKHREALIKADNIYASPACVKLVAKSMKREGLVDTPENWTKISDFSLTALKNDFYLEGFEMKDPEWAFDIQNEEPSYSINGFIDKVAFKGNVAKVVDYKSSKSKFSAEEQKFNIQAWMYALAIMKKYPNIKKVFINFLFLKFKKAPLQVVAPTKKELDGFEDYLAYLNKYLAEFDFKKACSSFGADNYKMKNLCGTREDRFKDDGSPKWRCPLMEPKDYWVEVDETGKDRKSSFEESDLAGSKYRVEKRRYLGCPRFFGENYRK